MIKLAAILKDGKVYTGRRHCHIINSRKELGLPFGYFRNSEQGFVDENGKFLTREEAAIEAIKCGQIKELKYSTKYLFSEEIIP